MSESFLLAFNIVLLSFFHSLYSWGSAASSEHTIANKVVFMICFCVFAVAHGWIILTEFRRELAFNSNLPNLILLNVAFYMHLIRQFISAHVKCGV